MYFETDLVLIEDTAPNIERILDSIASRRLDFDFLGHAWKCLVVCFRYVFISYTSSHSIFVGESSGNSQVLYIDRIREYVEDVVESF